MGIDLVVFAIRYDTGLDDYGKHPLKHAKLLTEVQSYCEASGPRWMNMDYLDNRRWDHYDAQEPPNICSTIGMTTNDEIIESQLGLKEQNLFMTPGRSIRICSHTISLNKCCILEEIFISKA